MDLKDLTPNLEDIVVTLKHPTTDEVLKNEDGTAMTITLLSGYSKKYKKLQHEQISKRLTKAQNSKSQEIDYSEIEEATVEVLSKATKSWNLTFGGTNPKLTAARAISMYEDVFWIRNQLEEALSDDLSFTTA